MELSYKISKSRTTEICKNTELHVKGLFTNPTISRLFLKSC